jgi:predicted LPLAT superfamily acyltransferase
MAQRYADHLGDHVRRFPTQWFNFIDFWGDCGPKAGP